MDLAGSIIFFLALTLVFFVAKFVFNASQLSFKGFAIVTLLLYVGIQLFTQPKSPLNVVDVFDEAIMNTEAKLGSSYTASRLVEVFGGNPGQLGLTSVDALVEQMAPETATTTETGGTTSHLVDSGTTVVSPTFPMMIDFIAGTWAYIPSTGIGRQVTSEMVCGWDDAGVNLVLCADNALVGSHNVANQAAIPPKPQPEYTQAELQSAMGACWMKWAGMYLTGTEADWSTNALPLDSGAWTLTGPGDWQTAFRGKAREVFTLSNPALDIVDYPINGYVGRSFPTFDDDSSVIVYGTNPNIIEWCLTNR